MNSAVSLISISISILMVWKLNDFNIVVVVRHFKAKETSKRDKKNKQINCLQKDKKLKKKTINRQLIDRVRQHCGMKKIYS